jgi:hypothetical protein
LRVPPSGKEASVTRLRRVDCSQPGIARRRRGRGFEYVALRVFDRYLSGWTIAPALEVGEDAFGLERESTRRVIEEAVIDLIQEPRESDVVEKVA